MRCFYLRQQGRLALGAGPLRHSCTERTTLHPKSGLASSAKKPKRVIPIHANPLARWSQSLAWDPSTCGCPTEYHDGRRLVLPVCVGLEGCNKAFNATNAIRTSLYFGSCAPPAFLGATSAADIWSLQTRSEAGDEEGPPINASPTMLFGPSLPPKGIESYACQCSSFSSTNTSTGSGWAVVALENYTERCVSIHSERVRLGALPALASTGTMAEEATTSFSARGNGGVCILMGDENKGVSSARLGGAGQVIYIPQYGTISSLNVVTTLGLALFYTWMDLMCPQNRTLISKEPSGVAQGLQASFSDYFTAYQKDLPMSSAGAETLQSTSGTPDTIADGRVEVAWDGSDWNNIKPGLVRVDGRPIHPMFYNLTDESIGSRYNAFFGGVERLCIDSLRAQAQAEGGQRCGAVAFSSHLTCVLYENDFDQRNLGGLIRNANAFMCPQVYYVGKKKINIKGAVGCNHYTPPMYLGKFAETEAYKQAKGSNQKGPGASDAVTNVKAMLESSGRTLWLLSCDHEAFYSSAPPDGDPEFAKCYSDDKSLAALMRLKAEGHKVTLTDPEDALRKALLYGGQSGGDDAVRGIVLLIPQEGKCPHPDLLRLCSGIIQILPRGLENGTLSNLSPTSALTCRGLPSQVASGIALHRLLTSFIPSLKL